MSLFSACGRFAFDEWSEGFVRAELTYENAASTVVLYELSEEEGSDLVNNLSQIPFRGANGTGPWKIQKEYAFRLFYTDKTIVIQDNALVFYDLDNQVMRNPNRTYQFYKIDFNKDFLDLLDYYIMKVNGITV